MLERRVVHLHTLLHTETRAHNQLREQYVDIVAYPPFGPHVPNAAYPRCGPHGPNAAAIVPWVSPGAALPTRATRTTRTYVDRFAEIRFPADQARQRCFVAQFQRCFAPHQTTENQVKSSLELAMTITNNDGVLVVPLARLLTRGRVDASARRAFRKTVTDAYVGRNDRDALGRLRHWHQRTKFRNTAFGQVVGRLLV